jgi:hypothetical protein
MTKTVKLSPPPTQRTLAKAFGVDVRTIKNWKRRADNGQHPFPFDKDGYWPLVRYNPERWLLVAKAKKLHEELIKNRFHDLCDAMIALEHFDRKKWHREPLSIHRKAAEYIEAVKAKSKGELCVAAKKLRLSRQDVTRETLAKILGYSVRTLIRRHGPKGTNTLSEICPRRQKPKLYYSDRELYNRAA